MDTIEMIAIQAIVVSQGIPRNHIKNATRGYPKLTSAVTAVFDVRVELTDEKTTFTVPVAVRVNYSHPIALDE